MSVERTNNYLPLRSTFPFHLCAGKIARAIGKDPANDNISPCHASNRVQLEANITRRLGFDIECYVSGFKVNFQGEQVIIRKDLATGEPERILAKGKANAGQKE